MTRPNNRADRLRETVVPGSPGPSPAQGSPAVPRAASVKLRLPVQLGEFLAKELLARGGMSVTLIGHVSGRPKDRVAIKVPLSQDPVTFARFNEESRLLRDLDHPSIVRFRSSGESELDVGVNGSPRKLPWLAMDYISGQSLRQRIKTEGAIPWQHVRKLLGDLVEALAYLHERHLCHRDIKPDNIIFDPRRKRWVLVDFGIAKAVSVNPRLTATLATQGPGSWDYMSPEQLDGKPVDTRTDIYSLGKTAWEALSGTVPRVGTPFPGATHLADGVSVEVDALIEKMVAHKPEDRYASPKELAEALAVGELRIRRRKRVKTSTHKLLTRLALASLLLAMIVGGWFAGDFFTTQDATRLLNANRESPTRAYRLFSNYATGMRYRIFRWGRDFVDGTIADLRPLAEQELSTMRDEYATVVKDLGRADLQDAYKLRRAQNFVRKWEDTFPDAQECRDLAHRTVDLKANAQASQTVATAKQLVKKGDVKTALHCCDDFLRSTKSKQARAVVQKCRAEIVDPYIADCLKTIDQEATSFPPTSLIAAEAQIQDLLNTVGTTQQLRERQQRYDARLWEWYQSHANTALNGNKYNAARRYAERYKEESPLKYHAADASALAATVTAKEDDTDWQTARESAEKNMAQNAFPLAVKDIRAYPNKWSDGRHKDDATALEGQIAASYLAYMRSFKDIDAFNEAFSVFREVQPREQAAIAALRKRLCRIAHRSITRIVSDKELDRSVKLSRLNGLDFRQCESGNIAYLNDLVNRATGYLNHSNKQSGWHLLWVLERPPADCIRMPSAPTVYEVTITRIVVQMDNSYYKRLHGFSFNHANPHIRIGIGTGTGSAYEAMSDILDIDGPIDERVFDVPLRNRPVWIDIEYAEKLWIRITDGDFGANGDNRPKFATIPASRLAQPGNEFEVQCDEGIHVTASWTSR